MILRIILKIFYTVNWPQSVNLESYLLSTVMLLEYFSESLVLLKHLVCVPYQALYSTHKNTRFYKKPSLTNQQQEIFNKFFKQDRMIYTYFEKSLQLKIKQFGQEVMPKRSTDRQLILCRNNHVPRCHTFLKKLFFFMGLHVWCVENGDAFGSSPISLRL